MEETDKTGNAVRERKDQQHGDPDGKAGGKPIEIIPSAVFLTDENHQRVIQRCVKKDRDQGKKAFPE